MAQLVAGRVGQPGAAPCPVKDLIQPGRRQRLAAAGTFQHHEHLPGRGHCGPFGFQVGAHGGEEPRRDRHYTLTAALALGHEQPPLAGAEVLQPQSEHFAAAQPAQHHRIHHGPVAVGPQRRPQRVDLGRREHPRQGAGRADQWHPAPATPCARPAGSQARRHRVAAHARVLPGAQIRIQAPHARQPPGDRPCRQARLAVLQPHDPLPAARGALRGQESEYIRSTHYGRLLANDLEEHLQVVGHGKPGVGPCTRRHEHQVVVQQRMPERDLPDLTVCRRADQAWHELQWVAPLPAGDRPRHAIMSLPLDHPHIKHRSLDMTLRYVKIASRTVADEYFAVTGKVEALYGQPPVLRADAIGPRWPGCAASTTGCSATATAPGPPSLTAPSSRSAKPARSSRPASSSGPVRADNLVHVMPLCDIR